MGYLRRRGASRGPVDSRDEL
uniref:Uncharacterized protein n=1 Tax=Arundo donax TaxID=35708 RepID=A0A0A9FEK7_ARUDO